MKPRAAFALLAAGAAVSAGAVAASFVSAQTPPPIPDFYWPYGTVQVNGQNISPQAQPIIAFVNGRSCGDAQTQYVEPDSDSQPVDGDRTVYVVDILADGTGPGHRAGCGSPGAPVTFWLPAIGRMADQHPSFKVGDERVNLTLGQLLGFERRVPLLANDGTP